MLLADEKPTKPHVESEDKCIGKGFLVVVSSLT